MKKGFVFYIIIIIIIFLPYCKKGKGKVNYSQKIEKAEKLQTKKNEKKVPILKLANKEFFDIDFINYLKKNVGSNYNQLPESVIDKIFNNFLNELYIYSYAKKEGVEISSKEIKYYLQKMKMENTTSVGQLEPYIMRKLIVEKFISQVLSSINISEQEIKNYYYKHLNLFRRPAEIRISQIVVKDEKEALDIRAKLQRNKTLFPKLAKEKSIGSESKRGGDMGYFSKGQLPKEIEKVVFSLNTGEISQVVKSPYGYHIFMITKKKRKRLMALKYVKDMIKLKIKQETFNKRWIGILNTAKKEIPLVIYKVNLDKLKKSIIKTEKTKTDNTYYNKKEKGE